MTGEQGVATQVRCPTCGRDVPWRADSLWRPFCSERCKLIDLGEWFNGGRAIPGDTDSPSADADTNGGDTDT